MFIGIPIIDTHSIVFVTIVQFNADTKKINIPPLDEVVSWSVHVLNTNANGIIFKKENKSMFQTDEWTNTSNFVNVIFCTLITKQEMQVTSIQQYTTSSTSSLYCPSKKWIANSVFFLHALFIIIKLDWHARIGTFYEYSPTDKAYMLSRTWNARQHFLWYIGIWNL